MHANLLPSWTAEIWSFNVYFLLNVDGQKAQLYELRVDGVSFWFILPTETHLAALAANCPSMYVAEEAETTWERHKNYGQFTTALEVRNIGPANGGGESGRPSNSITIPGFRQCSKGYINT